MTRRLTFKFQSQLFILHFGKTLFGLYFVLVQLSENEVVSHYGCKIVGPTTTSSCRPIDTKVPPEIHTPELRLEVQRGDNVYLPCRVHNLGVHQILWRHGNEIVAGSNITTFPEGRLRLRLLPDFTLELRRVVSNDEGIYQCLVTAWPPLNVTHTITVRDPPTLNIEPDTGFVTVYEGDSFQIGCIPGGNPTPEITWSKREGTIPLHPSMFTRRRIRIENVSSRESGVYVCIADNRVGRPAIGSIHVTVLHAPEVKTPNRRVHGGVRQRVQLFCIVHADPKPEVQWLFEQKPVPFSGRIFPENHGNKFYLNFNPVLEKDFGSYLCVGNNSLGYDMRHIEFSGVPNAPVVTRWETSPCTYPSDDDFLSCSVQVKLFWVVHCYSSLIDYRLHFRSAMAPVTSANEDQAPAWTELTIPADPTSPSTFLHSKSFTIHGLPNNTIFESAIRARNKFGWSFLSAVFYFTSVPNSSQKMSEAVESYTHSADDDNWTTGSQTSQNPSRGTEYEIEPANSSILLKMNILIKLLITSILISITIPMFSS